MKIAIESVFNIRYRYLMVLVLGIYSFLNIRFTVGDSLFDFPLSYFHLLTVIVVVILGIWESNRFLESKIVWITSRIGGRIHSLIILFVLSMFTTAITCLIVLLLLYTQLGMRIQFNFPHLTLLLAFGFRVNLFLNCVNAIVFFMNRARHMQVEGERLKQITIEAQFDALRNQINPHFLFNCFNVLSTLVYKDSEMSAKFIAQLSHVYRYLLYNQEKKIVSLAEELSFIQAYIYLLQIRFGDNLIIDNKTAGHENSFYIAPATVQMLIENAIKHNKVSRKNPLRVELSVKNNYLVISNILQEKELKEESSSLGLKNIRRRYDFLSQHPMVVEKTLTAFIVKIPLLQLDAT
ncbi:MAG: sensor histidine kinase [Chryseolinea sp.]